MSDLTDNLSKAGRFLPVIVLFAIVGYFAFKDINSAMGQAKPWMDTVVSENEVASLSWVQAHTPERTVFATDIFGGELVMSVLREGVEGGDWAIVPNVVSRMYDEQYHFYQTEDAKEAWQTALKYNASYAWVPDRRIFAGYEWKYPNYTIFDNATYFEKVFDNGHKIYRVKKPSEVK